MEPDENPLNDQDELTTEEKALLSEMEKDDGTGDAVAHTPTPAAAAPAPKGDKGGKKDKAPAAAKTDGAEVAPGAGDKGGDADPEAGDKGADGKTVPLAALHEERQARKDLQAELKAQSEAHTATMAKAMDRFERALAAFAPKPEEKKPDPVPDFEIDPAGWIAHTMQSQGKTLEEVQGELKTMKEEKAKNAETSKAEGEVREIFSYAITKENAFKAANPDYDAASAFLIKSRQEELSDLEYPPEQISQIINNERLAIAAKAKQDGKDPAEQVYKMAKRRGYAKAVAVDETDTDGGAAPVVTGEQKIDAAKKGAEHAVTLSNARGTAPSPLTAARLLEMSEAEFDRAMQTAEGRALMGN